METHAPKTFEEVRKRLDSIPAINSGGCGISVLAMHRWLMKNDDEYRTKNYDFICLHTQRDEEGYRTNVDSLMAGTGFCAPNHTYLCIDGKCWDSEGTGNPDWYYRHVGIKTEDNLLDMINHLERWNREFKRHTYVPIIAMELDIELDDVLIHSVPWSDRLEGFTSVLKHKLSLKYKNIIACLRKSIPWVRRV